MDLNPYMEELNALDRAREKLQEKFFNEIGKEVLEKFKSFEAESVWFNIKKEVQELEDITVVTANGRPIVVIPGEHTAASTDQYPPTYTAILRGNKRPYFVVSVERKK